MRIMSLDAMLAHSHNWKSISKVSDAFQHAGPAPRVECFELQSPTAPMSSPLPGRLIQIDPYGVSHTLPNLFSGISTFNKHTIPSYND